MARVRRSRPIDAVVERLRSNRLFLTLAAFVLLLCACAVVADAVGFPVVGGLFVAFGFLFVVITVLFVLVPVSALSLLD